MVHLDRYIPDARTLFLVLISAVLLTIIHCAPAPRVDERPERPLPVASNLQVTYRGEDALLEWQTNRQSEDLLSGYNIYISAEERIRDLPPSSDKLQSRLWRGVTYPGDTEPRTDVESAEISGLEYGTRYFIHVRTVGVNGAIGPPSPEISVIPRPEGECTLTPRFSGGEDGYHFAAQEYVPARDIQNDLYLYVRQDSIFAASPHRLNPANRARTLYHLGSAGSIAGFPQVENLGPGQETVYLVEGHGYLLVTPEQYHVKFRVQDIVFADDIPEVTIEYIVQL